MRVPPRACIETAIYPLIRIDTHEIVESITVDICKNTFGAIGRKVSGLPGKGGGAAPTVEPPHATAVPSEDPVLSVCQYTTEQRVVIGDSGIDG